MQIDGPSAGVSLGPSIQPWCSPPSRERSTMDWDLGAARTALLET